MSKFDVNNDRTYQLWPDLLDLIRIVFNMLYKFPTIVAKQIRLQIIVSGYPKVTLVISIFMQEEMLL